MTTLVPKPLRLFCSYSHKDEGHLNDLRDWLRGLERQGLIEWWHDREITPGWEWEEEIDKNLRTADVILLLVSPAFMASDYVHENEIGKAVERHERGEARVIPIIVRPTLWKGTGLDRLQALPKDAKPITRWSDRDEAWLNVAEGIARALHNLIEERTRKPSAATDLGIHRELDRSAKIKHAVTDHTAETIQESEEDNADFEVLQRLERSDHKFFHEELEELRRLLGLYGRKIEKRLPLGKAGTGYVSERMQHWKRKKDQPAARSIERAVAERAYSRYGVIYAQLVAPRPLSIGIDFGTANSSMAWCAPETGLAEVILNAEGEVKTPSVVYFGENETLVGKLVEDLLEDVEYTTDPKERNDVYQRIVSGIKRNLLSPPIIPIPGREAVRPLDVVAHILGKLKYDAEQLHFNEEVERVVVACPATFDLQRRQVLREGAAKAGFREVELLDEPIAVALALTKQGQDLGKGMIVYDLGAQRFNLSVVARESEDSPYQVLKEPQGDPYFGADDLDLALYDYCDAIAMKELGRHISLTNELDLAFLRQCRSRKENLSMRTSAIFSSYLSSENGPQRFKHKVHREAFENLVRPRIESTVKMTVNLWEQVQDQVDGVILIGGASRIPVVCQRLEEALPVKARSLAGRDQAVAQGAAYKAYELSIEETRHHHG